MNASFRYPREGGFRRLLTVASAGVGPGLAIFPPNPIEQLVSFVVDRFRKPASQRVSQQAMIVNAVRIQHLIALLARQSSDAIHDPTSSRLDRVGLFEEPQPHQSGTGQWRGSARNRPQTYGKNSKVVFDVEGLIHWLRSRYPRSTVHHVEAETGIAAASVENWLHRRSQPSVEHFMIMLTVFGPALLHACLRQKPGWVENAAKAERARQIDEEIARLQGERLKVVAG